MNKMIRTATAKPMNPLWPRGSVDAAGKKRAGRMSVKDMEAHPDQSILQGHRDRQDAAKASGNQWLSQNKASVQNLVNLHNQATPEQLSQGEHWYPGTNHVAHIMARDASARTGIPRTADQAVGHLANYSPQTGWFDNLLQASLALHAKDPKHVPGSGGAGWKSPFDHKGFMSSNAQATASQAINAGADWRDVKGIGDQKVGNFGRNMSAGGLDPEGHDPLSGSHVPLTIDRHMLSAAHGGFAGPMEYELSGVSSKPKVYDQYRSQLADAKNQINQQNGTNLNGSQVQAQLWLAQQDKNERENGGSAAQASKNRWNAYAAIHHPDLVDSTPGTGNAGAGGMAASSGRVVPTSHGMPTWQEQEPDFHEIPTGAPTAVPGKAASIVRTASSAFDYDADADQFKTSDLDAKFRCNCGTKFATANIGLHRCEGCKKTYTSFDIINPNKTAANGGTIRVVREVREHRDRVLAKVGSINPLIDQQTSLDIIKSAIRHSIKTSAIVRTSAKSNKCEKCDDQATVKALHAEGMAYVPACDKHKAAVAKSLGSEFCSFRPYDKAKTASEGLLSGEGKSQKELEDDPDNTDYQSANSTNREPERHNTVAVPNEYTEGIPTPYFVRRTSDPAEDHAPVVLDDGEDNHSYRAAFLAHQAAFLATR